MKKNRGPCYIAVKFSHRRRLGSYISAVASTLRSLGFRPFVFVNSYKKLGRDDARMMQEAFTLIRKSKLLLAETSTASVGVGIEMGYAASLKIPIVCVQKARTKSSSTTRGTAWRVLTYQAAGDLKRKLFNLLS